MRREGSAESGQVGGEWWVQGLGVLEGGFPREEATGFVRNLMQRGHFSGAVTVFLGGGKGNPAMTKSTVPVRLDSKMSAQ